VEARDGGLTQRSLPESLKDRVVHDDGPILLRGRRLKALRVGIPASLRSMGFILELDFKMSSRDRNGRGIFSVAFFFLKCGIGLCIELSNWRARSQCYKRTSIGESITE